MSDVTSSLNAPGNSEGNAADELLPLVYEQLRQLAAHKLAGEASTQTLQPTALVHEAWLRLTGSDHGAADPRWQGRRHFFGAAAQAMRNILVERARRKSRPKHGGDLQRVDVEEVQLAEIMRPEELLALDEALARLEEFDPEAAELIKLRFFAGFTQQQAAELLGSNKRAADRLWSFARAFLLREIQATQGGGG